MEPPLLRYTTSHNPWGSICLSLVIKPRRQLYLDAKSSYRLHYCSIVSGLFALKGLNKTGVYAFPPQPTYHTTRWLCLLILTQVRPFFCKPQLFSVHEHHSEQNWDLREEILKSCYLLYLQALPTFSLQFFTAQQKFHSTSLLSLLSLLLQLK